MGPKHEEQMRNFDIDSTGCADADPGVAAEHAGFKAATLSFVPLAT
jgi:hypothetical protein